MMSNPLSRRAVLRAAAGTTLAVGATALGGRATAAPGGAAAPQRAVQATVSDKVTWWDATSVAGPAAIHASAYSTVVAWRGDRNSRNLTVANVRRTSSGKYAGSTLQKWILSDSSENAPTIAGGTAYRSALRLAWSGTNGGHSLNAAILGLEPGNWTFTGQIIGRKLVAGNLVSCTTGPAWGTSIGQNHQLVVANQYNDVIVTEETSELTFTAPATLGFLTNPRGAVHSLYDGDTGSTVWAWTASDGSITFATINVYGHATVARSAQKSNYAPSKMAFAGAGRDRYIAWTTPAGRIALAWVDIAAIVRGADPIGAVATLPEQSLATPELLTHAAASGSGPAFDLFWTGVDGTGALNAAVVTF